MAAEGVTFLFNPENPTRGHVVLSDGSIRPRGGATQIISPYRQDASQGRHARVVAAQIWDWDLRSGYLFDSSGGVHRFSDGALPPALNPPPPYFPDWDVVRDVVLRPDVANYGYLADMLGGVHRIGVAPGITQGQMFDDDRIRALAVLRWDPSPQLYKLSRKGGILSVNGAPEIEGPFDFDGDLARDLEVSPDGSAWYTLDNWGAITPGGTAKPIKFADVHEWRDFAHDLVVEAWGPPARLWRLHGRDSIRFFTTTTKPVVTISAPPATSVDDSYPPVRWSVSDVQGEPQSKYRVVYFTEAQTEVPAFDPAESPNLWDSGIRRGRNVRVVRPTVVIPDGDTFVYVRSWNASDERSDWASRGFVQRVLGPAKPELSVVFDAAAGKATLTVVQADNLLSEETADPEADLDAGSWHPIALGEPAELATEIARYGTASLKMKATGAGTMIYRGDVEVAPAKVGTYKLRGLIRGDVSRNARLVLRRRSGPGGPVTHTITTPWTPEV